MLLIYRLIYAVAMAFLLPLETIRRPKGKRLQWLREKLGLYGRADSASGGEASIWVHAVSVGEVSASVPFIKALKEEYPEIKIVLSTVTDTGRKVASERLSDYARVVYLPFDLKSAVRRAIRGLSPSFFVVMETELWPVIFDELMKQGIPIAVMNGRISGESFRGYMKVRFFMKRVLRCVSLFCMQDAEYARRIKELGAEPGRVKVSGNFKFDTAPKDGRLKWAERLGGLLIVAGSTHRGEEELIVSAFIRLRKEFPDVGLVLAPRHPERFEEAAGILRAKGVEFIRRSAIEGQKGPIPPVLLLDTIGELSSVYGRAEIAVTGGSFIGHGGQNPLEAASWGKPVVCGPHMENFPFIEEFYEAQAAVKTDSARLYETLRDLVSSEEKRRAIGDMAGEIFKRNAGSVRRAIGHFSGLWGTGK